MPEARAAAALGYRRGVAGRSGAKRRKPTVITLLVAVVVLVVALLFPDLVPGDDGSVGGGVDAGGAADVGSSSPGSPMPEARVEDALADALPGSAMAAVGDLRVAGRAPKTGYERERYGSAWSDVDDNGCDTRNDVLARDLRSVSTQGEGSCVVESGTLRDPYGGSTIDFQRGRSTSSAVQIDHVIALSDAWQTGAGRWERDKRVRFANDPLNLLAVDGPLNGAKSDGDAATWLPPNKGFRCPYVARQVALKGDYGLWVKPAERAAMVKVLATCPDQGLPAPVLGTR